MPSDTNVRNEQHRASKSGSAADRRQQFGRRSFLSLCASASIAPALPLYGKLGVATAGAYNRYTYGYAVFRICHGGAIDAADLAATLRLPLSQANQMIAQMTKDGIVRSTGAGAVQAVATHGGRLGQSSYIRKAARLAAQAIDQMDDPRLNSADQTETPKTRTDVIPTW